MFKHIQIGISTYIASFSFIHKHKLYSLFLIPGLLSLLLLSVGIYLIFSLSMNLSDYILNNLNLNDLPIWALSLIKITLGIIIRLISFLTLGVVFRYLILIVLSPVLSFIVQKIEYIQGYKEQSFSFTQILKDVIRAIKITLSNSVIQIGIIVLLSLLSFIPVIGYICPVIIFIIEFYYLGFSLLDYTLEVKNYNVKETRVFLKKHRTLAMTNGIFFYAWLIIPIFGWMIGPIIGTIAANISVNKILRENESSQALSNS